MDIKKYGTYLMKNFKIIHFLLFILTTYIIVKTNDIYNFFTVYLKDLSFNYNPNIINDYFNSRYLFSILIITLAVSIIMLFLKIKQKTWYPYLLMTINNGLLIIVLLLGYNLMTIIEYNIPSIVYILFIRGLYFIIIAFQYYTLFYFGFIAASLSKSYDFKKELAKRTKKDLVTIETLKENKVLVSIISVIIIMWLIVTLFFNFNLNHHNYNITNAVTIGSIQMSTHEAYITDVDMKGNFIAKDNQKYLVVLFDLKNSSEVITTLDVNKISLKLNKKTYQVNKEAYSYFYDYGLGFNNQGVSSTKGQYFYLVFVVDNLKADNKAYLRYEKVKTSKIQTYYETKVEINNIKDITKIVKANLKENLYLAGSPLKNTVIKVNKYEIKKQFSQQYQICIQKNTCIDQTENIVPNNPNNQILMLNMKTKFDTSVNSDVFASSSDLLSSLAKLSYKDNKDQPHTIAVKTIDSYKSNNNVYIEIPANVKKSIALEFVIRNRQFAYILSE